MTVKILIERKFKEAPKLDDIGFINDLRIKATAQEGYISGETLIETEDNRTMLVLSIWSTLDEWKTWADSQERHKLEEKLNIRLEKPPAIRSYFLAADYLRKMLVKA